MTRRAWWWSVVVLGPALALAAEPRPAVSPAWIDEVRAAIRTTGAAAVVVGRRRVPLDELDADDVPPAGLSMLAGLEPSTATDIGRVLQKWVQLPGQPATPVRVLLAADAVRVEVGPPRPPARASASTDELARRWGLPPFREDGAAFSPAMLAGVEVALPLLAPRERTMLTGIGFVAMPTDPQGAGAAARYHGLGNGEPGTVQLYADLVDRDDGLFSGCARRPLPESTHAVLHELGHAVADAPGRVARQRLAALRQAIEARQRALVDGAAELERARTEGRPAPTDRQAVATYTDALVAWRDRLVAERDAVVLAGADLRDAQARIEAWYELGPVVTAYAALPGALDGPTPYGRTRPGESFAEAFALWHTDPDAVALLWPEVGRWFAAGGHLAAIDAALASIATDPVLGAVGTSPGE